MTSPKQHLVVPNPGWKLRQQALELPVVAAWMERTDGWNHSQTPQRRTFAPCSALVLKLLIVSPSATTDLEFVKPSPSYGTSSWLLAPQSTFAHGVAKVLVRTA